MNEMSWLVAVKALKIMNGGAAIMSAVGAVLPGVAIPMRIVFTGLAGANGYLAYTWIREEEDVRVRMIADGVKEVLEDK